MPDRKNVPTGSGKKPDPKNGPYHKEKTPHSSKKKAKVGSPSEESTIKEDDAIQVHQADRPSERVFRRFMHISYALIVLVYLFPETIYGYPRIYFLALFFVAVPIIIETIRIRKGARIYGMRDHEQAHVASYAWFCIGSVLLVWLFPPQIAAPCIVATAIGDVVIGETVKLRRRYAFAIPIGVVMVIFLVFKYSIPLAILAGSIAFVAEATEFDITWRLRSKLFWSRSTGEISPLKKYSKIIFKTDDDFMMQFIPAIYLGLLWLWDPGIFPAEPLIAPLEMLATLA